MIGLDDLTGVAAILKYALPGIDDIEEEDKDIDQIINEGDEDEDEEQKSTDGPGKKGEPKKLTFDEEQLEILLRDMGDDAEGDEGEEEIVDDGGF